MIYERECQNRDSGAHCIASHFILTGLCRRWVTGVKSFLFQYVCYVIPVQFESGEKVEESEWRKSNLFLKQTRNPNKTHGKWWSVWSNNIGRDRPILGNGLTLPVNINKFQFIRCSCNVFWFIVCASVRVFYRTHIVYNTIIHPTSPMRLK